MPSAFTMKRTILAASAAVLTAAAAAAAPDAQSKSKSNASYEQFRQQLYNDYNDFRSTVLDHYADFLGGVWHEYEPLEPLVRDSVPKPSKAPTVSPEMKTDKIQIRLPKPNVSKWIGYVKNKLGLGGDSKSAGKDAQKDASASRQQSASSFFDTPPLVKPEQAGAEVSLRTKLPTKVGVSLIDVSAELPEKVKLAVSGADSIAPAPLEAVADVAPDLTNCDMVDFYGMQIPVPYAGFRISQTLPTIYDFSDHWTLLEDQDVFEIAQETLLPVIEDLGLNDYLAYEFISAYMDSKFPDAAEAPKRSAVHYIMSNMGYDIRLALLEPMGKTVLLLPSEQVLYGVANTDYGSRKYWIVERNLPSLDDQKIASPMLPDTSKGKKFDFRIRNLNLPEKPRPFRVEYDGISLAGTLNENIMPIVYRYPQMDMGGFAESVLDRDLRDDLVRQLKAQLEPYKGLDAINQLLHFTQNAFAYKTDWDFHGFEKPYFVEENLYYPLNDCEDRAIFYTYMLWNALGVENHLLNYPGHEAASVMVPDVRIYGYSYEYDGKPFYISDPTYIDASTGMCMGAYQNVGPVIDHVNPDFNK